MALSELDSNHVHSPQQFFQAVNHFGTTFNWPYIDNKHIAYFSSGRLPIMAPGTDPSLPALGTGKYDWRGWLPLNAHPHMIEPRSDSPHQLEQQAGPGLGRGLGQLRLRLGAPGRSCTAASRRECTETTTSRS